MRGDAQNGARLDAKNGTTPDAEYEAQPVAGPVVGRGPQCDADNTSGSRSRAAARRKKRRVRHDVRKEDRRYRRSLRREARAREREVLKQLPKRERLHAWWRTRPLGVTFTVYLAVYLAAATLLALGMVEVLSTWNNGYYELEVSLENGLTQRGTIDSGPYVYDPNAGELLPASELDLPGDGPYAVFIATGDWGTGSGYVPDGGRTIGSLYATVDLVRSGQVQLYDWGLNYNEGYPQEEILEANSTISADNLARYDELSRKGRAQSVELFESMTGADLENLMNEAAINAAKSKQGYISQRDIEQSFVKVGIGAEKHSKVISDKEKRITAYHESGHAILFHVLPHESQVHTISIIPTGMGAAGYTMPLPEADEMFMTKKRMEEDIIVAFGGRVAEELIFGDVTTGASQDIKQATATARAMVVKYGMSERLGTINYEDSGEEEVFLGRDLGHARSYSEDVAREIDIEVKRIIDEAYAQAKTIITEHMDVLHRCAQVLIEREKIGNAEFEAIFDGRELPEPGAEQTSLMSGMPSEGR